jgi:malate dehydrogenase (oxaloacetate-decarboxylating)
LPGFDDIRNISFHIAKAVALEARNSGLGRNIDDSEYEKVIRKAQWFPEYYKYRPGTRYRGLSEKIY